MIPVPNRFALSALLAVLLLLESQSAHALRCGNRLVKDGMYELQVIELCGEPVSKRYIGYVVRPHILELSAGPFEHHATRHAFSGYYDELMVTELLFNFGPHKLMRILRFEGGRLASIRTAGYGYRE